MSASPTTTAAAPQLPSKPAEGMNGHGSPVATVENSMVVGNAGQAPEVPRREGMGEEGYGESAT